MDLLVVEDDRLVCQTIASAWPTPSDRLRFVSTYRQSLGYIHGPELDRFDGAIIDINLPDGDGINILRTIREKTNVPIVLISGSGTADNRADAITIGADDYVMKPFSVRELHARIARLVNVRRDDMAAQAASARDTFKLGGVTCDLQGRTLACNDREITLTDAESRLLDALYRNFNRVCSKSYLYKSAFFRDHDPSDNTLDVYVSRVRRKLRSLDPSSAKWIQTVRGSGYRASELA